MHNTYDHSVCIIWQLFNQSAMQIDWFLRDLDAVIKVYSSYFTYVQFIIYLFVLCYYYFCLFILLILLFLVVVYSFRSSCSESFIVLSVISTLLFMLPVFKKSLFICYYYSYFCYFWVNSLCFQFTLLSLQSLWFSISSCSLAANSISLWFFAMVILM